MDEKFWLERWQQNDIGFHKENPHHVLLNHYNRLEMRPHDRVFVPLCGKSPDLVWLNNRELDVVGVELSRMALEAFVTENRLRGEWSVTAQKPCWRGERYRLFCEDFFQLQASDLGPVNAAYDRGSLVAMPDAMRQAYAEHLARLMSSESRVLAISYEYDQDETDGPPFSVPLDEIRRLFSRDFQIELLTEEDTLWSHQGLAARGVSSLVEFAVLLTRV